MAHVNSIGYRRLSQILDVNCVTLKALGQALAPELRGKRIMLLGAAGSGKGTCDKALEDLGNVVTLSAGDLIRREMSANEEFLAKVGPTVAAGKLLEDDVFMPLLDKAVKSSGNNGIILDWHPRSVSQLDYLYPILGNLDAVVYINVPKELLRIRVVNRLTCKNRDCRTVYNTVFDMPKKAPDRCDRCKSPLEKRDTDTNETFDIRMAEFREGTRKVVDHFSRHRRAIFLPVSCIVKRSQRVNDKYLLKAPGGGNYLFNDDFVLNIDGVNLMLFASLLLKFTRGRHLY